MFAKLKSSNSPTPPEKLLPATPLDINPISEYFDVRKQVGSAGPELAWKIYDAVRRSDDTEVSIFFFDKRWADRMYKGTKRREVIVDVLRKGVHQLESMDHPRLLAVIQGLAETSDTMAFATEPVLGSLANILGCLEDRLRQGIPSSLREYTFCEFEHTYGLLQSVIVNKRGTWKLAGMEFVERCSEGDMMLPVSCQPYTSKLPKMSQPDLDFVAPEVQSSSACSPQSDLFSLGLLILSLYNNGRSPIESTFSSAIYFKQLETLNQNMSEIVERMPNLLREAVQSMVEAAPRKRPTSQNVAMNRYFMDPGVHALQYMDAISGKDQGYRINFYHNLREILNLIPKKMWFQNLVPGMEKEVADHGSEGLDAVLEPVLLIVSECTRDEYQTHVLPLLRKIFPLTKSIHSAQATALLLENLEILIEKTARSDFQSDVLPLILNSFETNVPELQSIALKAISRVMDDLDDETIKSRVLPKAKNAFSRDCDTEVQENVLACILRVLDDFDEREAESEILPMLLQAQLSHPTVRISAARIYRHLISERMLRNKGDILATIVMPSFFPVIVEPSLEFDDFIIVSEMLQEMFDLVTKQQRVKLKQDDVPMVDTIPIQFKMALDVASPTCPFPDENRASFSFNVEAPSRRASVCSEYVSNIMRATSPDSSPDTEPERSPFLGVSDMKQRRHSDNSLQISKTLSSGASNGSIHSLNRPASSLSPVAPISRARSSSSLTNSGSRRRHSSVNPHDIQRFATKLMDSAAESMVESVEKASKATSGMHLGLESMAVRGLSPLPSPGSGSRRGSRRCSVVDIITQPSCLTSASKSKSPKPSKKIFNRIGSEMHNLLKK